MNILPRALAISQRLASRLAGGLIEYSRGELTCTLPAVYGRTQYQADDTQNGGTVRIEYDDRDFLIAAVNLVLGGVRTEPQDSDRVTILDGPDAGECYEIMPVPGKKCFERRDPQGIGLRAHAKRIAANQ